MSKPEFFVTPGYGDYLRANLHHLDFLDQGLIGASFTAPSQSAPSHTVFRLQPTALTLTLNDTDERDLNTLTNVARVLLQDASDVFAVIERRGF